MKATIELDLKPFRVPNFVLAEASPSPRQKGDHEETKFALADLDPGTLERLCEEFTREVFKKAGKRRPERLECGC